MSLSFPTWLNSPSCNEKTSFCPPPHIIKASAIISFQMSSYVHDDKGPIYTWKMDKLQFYK